MFFYITLILLTSSAIDQELRLCKHIFTSLKRRRKCKNDSASQCNVVSNICLQKTYLILLRVFRPAVVDTYLVIFYTFMA